MSSSADVTPSRSAGPLEQLAEQASAKVAHWLRTAQDSGASPHPSAQRLSAVLSDPRGLDFTVGFVDRVIRTEDNRAAARALTDLAELAPTTLSALDRAQIKAGSLLGKGLPGVVTPAARARMRSMVGHMVVDARDKQFGKAVARITQDGNRLNINLLGEAVLGEAEADKHLEDTVRLLRRDDVDYVSIKASSIASQISMWGFEETVDYVVERLAPMYREAAKAPAGSKFINLDMEEYRDLHLTIAVFKRLLSLPGLHEYEAGIVLQAYLPDALGAMQELAEFAAARVAGGGAGIKVRLVKGANLAMETVHGEIAGWPTVTCESKEATDANYKLVLHWLLTTENMAGVRLGVAGHNLFDIAFAHLLGVQRGVSHRLEFEMLQGMAAEQAEAVRQDVGQLLLYVPAVHPQEFDVAVSYLVRRLEENAASENFMSGIFDLAPGSEIFRREESRFLASVELLEDILQRHGHTPPASQHRQDRLAEQAHEPDVVTRYTELPTFANEPDTDPSLPQNQQWARQLMAQAAEPGWLDRQSVPEAVEAHQIDELISTAKQAARNWATRPARERAQILYRAADLLAYRRGHLISLAAAEAGKSVAQTDPEVSEAIDFARYYAHSALELEKIDYARFEPDQLVLITPPWNFPLAIPAGGTFAALAAGAAVIHKPSRPTPHCSMAILEALWDAGVPRDVLHGVYPDEQEAGRKLVSHPDVDRVILTGASETAAMFSSWRSDLRINAETSGKNALVVTPAADRDLAVQDLVHSAFGHAGQKCSAASLGILVGSVYHSERFRRQLVDAASSLVVDWPANLSATVGPLTEPPSEKLLRALTTLEPGERWLLEPKQLDETGKLWSPGIKEGVAPDSFFHLTECFGPVLGLMRAADLDEAIDLQNGTDFGLTAGIHSLEPSEVRHWIDRVEAGNAYVNRGITGAIVQRQSFGGWKKSSVGLGSKAGGPNYVMLFGSWHDVAGPADSAADPRGTAAATLPARPGSSLAEQGPSPESSLGSFSGSELPYSSGQRTVAGFLSALEKGQALKITQTSDHRCIDWLRTAIGDDERWWCQEFGRSHDKTGLKAEANVFRYLPEQTLLRVSEDAEPACVARALAAAARAGVTAEISVAPDASPHVTEVLEAAQQNLGAQVIDRAADPQFAEGLAAGSYDRGVGVRVRFAGTVPAIVRDQSAPRPEVALLDGEITASGRVELRYWVKEQAVSMTLHRFGNPSPAFHEIAADLRGTHAREKAAEQAGERTERNRR